MLQVQHEVVHTGSDPAQRFSCWFSTIGLACLLLAQIMKNRFACWSLLCGLTLLATFPLSARTVVVPADVIQDKIRGGLLGQILGDLNGLAHEMKYIAEPGNVTDYTPSLSDGAWTDDDTDFEWVYVLAMQRERRLLLPPQRISQLWKTHINRKFWCANQYARQLMDLGIDPPLTGLLALNPWSDFNLSGQFLCETFGLLAPGMPRTAARLGLNYTRVAIDGGPAQTTQLFDTMIATAFFTNDLNAILEAGLRAVDARSDVRTIVLEVRRWHQENPKDWRSTRHSIKEKYSRFNGAMRDKNGYELNAASVIGALLYGEGDFAKTLQLAFNFGWDCDNNAATAGTIIGVIKGNRWLTSQGWNIQDRFRNTTRDEMPGDETITSFGDRLIDLAEQVMREQGGSPVNHSGTVAYRIKLESPANVRPLANPVRQAEQAVARLRPEIERDLLRGTLAPQARAAYLAIGLDQAGSLEARYPEAWKQALMALQRYPKVLEALFYDSPTPAGNKLREKARAAGLTPPVHREKLW